MVLERIDDGLRGVNLRAVVEGEDDFFVFEEIIGFVLFKAETGSACGVDFDCSRDAKGVGVGADGFLATGDGVGRGAFVGLVVPASAVAVAVASVTAKAVRSTRISSPSIFEADHIMR
jgi:hypothetical protein